MEFAFTPPVVPCPWVRVQGVYPLMRLFRMQRPFLEIHSVWYHDPSPYAMTRLALAPCSPFSVSLDLMRGCTKGTTPYSGYSQSPPLRCQVSPLLPVQFQLPASLQHQLLFGHTSGTCPCPPSRVWLPVRTRSYSVFLKAWAKALAVAKESPPAKA